MLGGDFRQFSLERLLRFLVALGQDVEIVIKPHRGTRKAAAARGGPLGRTCGAKLTEQNHTIRASYEEPPQ